VIQAGATVTGGTYSILSISAQGTDAGALVFNQSGDGRSGCSWTATSPVSWAQVSTSIVIVIVAPNDIFGAVRALTIAGEAFTVMQAAGLLVSDIRIDAGSRLL
jgi:hypothetical protein